MKNRGLRNRLLLLGLFNVIIVVLLLGCSGELLKMGAYKKDHSDNNNLWGEFERDQQYALIEDVLLKKGDAIVAAYSIVPPREFTPSDFGLAHKAPQTIQNYREEKAKGQWHDYQGVLTAGTKIKCTKIIEHGSWSVEGFIKLYAEIVDGPFQGITAEINDMTVRQKSESENFWYFTPNDKLLKAQ